MTRTHELTPQAAPDRDEVYWRAVVAHDASFDGKFYYAVASTGVYCRPSCAARRPKRENVSFFTATAAAERAGFRACKRCRPGEAPPARANAEKVAAACRLIETTDETLKLDALAEAVGLSPYHFHRLFKAATGVTPKAYASAHRRSRVRDRLGKSGTVTEAIYDSGFNSNGRFYAGAVEALGMTPTDFRQGGRNQVLRYAIGACSLGQVLVAASQKGISAIMLGDDPEDLLRHLQGQFPRAQLISGDTSFERLVAKVIAFVDNPAKGLDLPLDVQGTAFQQRVWDALRRIPAGRTRTYTEIADEIGAPTAARAVAGACASNRIAVAIPCHRVVRSGGAISGYRWGVERKRALLDKEAKS
jgi:AraC family transcriptional regulator, regulatory protein of adaptative response / methylated-DNA-[protein]-cysteine methyltransferase